MEVDLVNIMCGYYSYRSMNNLWLYIQSPIHSHIGVTAVT